MDFSSWLLHAQKTRELDIKGLERITGVDKATLSRIENKKSEPTLLTAVRICSGMGVTLEELAEALLHIKITRPEHPGSVGILNGGDFLTLQDIEALTNSFFLNQERWSQTFVSSFNDIYIPGSKRDSHRIFVPQDITKLLVDTSLHKFDLQYPPELDPKLILEMYLSGGLITINDVGLYLKGIRNQQNIRLGTLEKLVNISDTVLSRLEAGVLERIKITDVIRLDENLDQQGKFFALYWHSCLSNEELSRLHLTQVHSGSSLVIPSFQSFKIAHLFITISRWLQYTKPDDKNWARILRDEYTRLASQSTEFHSLESVNLDNSN
jgi:transcriptional regulator with XRE-family HTH domain